MNLLDRMEERLSSPGLDEPEPDEAPEDTLNFELDFRSIRALVRVARVAETIDLREQDLPHTGPTRAKIQALHLELLPLLELVDAE